MRSFCVAGIAALLGVAACGGSVPGNSKEHPDAKPQQHPDGSLCKSQVVEPSYGSLDGSGGVASVAMNGADVFQLHLDTATTPDVLSVELYSGFGPFVAGVKNGTFNLSTQQSFGDCGACVLIYGDENLSCTDPNGDCSKEYYMPTSGTLTLTSFQGRLTGSLADVVFQHVDIDFTHLNAGGQHDYPTTSADDHCGSAVTAVSFDRPYDSSATVDAGTTDLK